MANDRDLLVDIKSVSRNIAYSVEEAVRTITEIDYDSGESGMNVSFVELDLPNPCVAITNEIERRLGGRLAE